MTSTTNQLTAEEVQALGLEGRLYDPSAAGFYQDPYPFYQRLRSYDPVYWSAQGVWLVTGFDQASSVLKDRRFSSQSVDFGSAEDASIESDDTGAMTAALAGNPIFMDPPDHTRLRRLVGKALTPRAIESLRPFIQEYVDQLIDQANIEGEFDFMSLVAQPLPLRVIGQLFGSPMEDQSKIAEWSEQINQIANVDQTPETMAASIEGCVQVRNYIRTLVQSHKREPRDDILGRLVAAEEQGDMLSEEELVGFGLALLTAGHETTTSFLGNSMYVLLNHPEEWEKLKTDPGLLPSALEELLRYEAPVQMTVGPRLAVEDTEVGDHLVKAGQVVRVIIGAANRDPVQILEPERFDISRDEIRHLSFASGIHTCPGAHLTRLEVEIAITAIAKRLPDLSLAERPRYKEGTVSRKLESLKVVV